MMSAPLKLFRVRAAHRDSALLAISESDQSLTCQPACCASSTLAGCLMTTTASLLFVCTRSVRRVCRHCMGSEFTRSSAPVVSSAQVVLPVVFYCWIVLPLLATELDCVLLFPLALVLRHHREEIADGRQKR